MVRVTPELQRRHLSCGERSKNEFWYLMILWSLLFLFCPLSLSGTWGTVFSAVCSLGSAPHQRTKKACDFVFFLSFFYLRTFPFGFGSSFAVVFGGFEEGVNRDCGKGSSRGVLVGRYFDLKRKAEVKRWRGKDVCG